MALIATTPSGPCRPHAADRLCHDVPGPRRGMRPDRSQRDRAPRRSAARPPQDHDQRPQPSAIGAVARGAHHRDDLLHRRRISGIAPAFVPRGATLVKARHRDRRTTTTGSVIQNGMHGALPMGDDGTVQSSTHARPSSPDAGRRPPANRARCICTRSARTNAPFGSIRRTRASTAAITRAWRAIQMSPTRSPPCTPRGRSKRSWDRVALAARSGKRWTAGRSAWSWHQGRSSLLRTDQRARSR